MASKRKRVKWLNRALLVGPYITLCTSAREYRAAMRHLKCEPDQWLRDGFEGKAHILTDSDGDMTAIVCIAPNKPTASVAALIAHEAVHVWQHYRDHIGETSPGSETEAYAVQGMTFVLLSEYMRRAKRHGD